MKKLDVNSSPRLIKHFTTKTWSSGNVFYRTLWSNYHSGRFNPEEAALGNNELEPVQVPEHVPTLWRRQICLRRELNPPPLFFVV